MSRMIFVNLPVKNLDNSKKFFGKLGFEFNPEFSDEKAACMVVEDNIFVMLLADKFFKTFINDEITDTSKSTEVITCISASSTDEVDSMIEKAMRAGGKPWKDVMKEGSMYGGSFQDVDGHVWEVMHMDQAAKK